MAVLRVLDIVNADGSQGHSADDCAHSIRMAIFAFDDLHAKVLAHEPDLTEQWEKIAESLKEFKTAATEAGFHFPEPKNELRFHGSRLEYPNIF